MAEASLTVKYLKGILLVWWLMQSRDQSKYWKINVLLEADVAKGKICCEFLNTGSDSRFDRADFVLIEGLAKLIASIDTDRHSGQTDWGNGIIVDFC